MPVARYFLFVGAVLLALLFVLDAFAPRQVAVANNSTPSIEKTVVRIRSDQKLPERVVYDTSLATIVPPVVANAQVAPAPPPPVDITARGHARDTFAQLVPSETKKHEAQVQRKRRIAKVRPAQPMMRFAQQSHFGFFGAPVWHSTW